MEQNPYGGGHRRGGPPEGKEPAWISGLGEDYNMFMDRFLQAGEEGAQQQAPQPATDSQPGLRLRGAASRAGNSSSSLEEQQQAARLPPGTSRAQPSDDPAGPSDSLESAEDVGGGSRSGSGISQQCGKPRAEGKPRGKRKLPVPDLESIEDPAERRKQRRLLKNRNTAAASRERKQKELEELMSRTQSLERDNDALRRQLRSRDGEIQELNAEVSRLSGRPVASGSGSLEPSATSEGAAGPRWQRRLEDDQEILRLPLPQPEPLAAAAAQQQQQIVPGCPLPMPASGPDGQGGLPGLVVGVDGQWLRLRPGYELQGAPSADDSSPHQQHARQHQQQQRRRPPRPRERNLGESDEDDEDLEEPDEAPDGGDDSDWEPDIRSRGRPRSARHQRGSQAWAPN